MGKIKKIELVEKSYAYGIKPKNSEQTFALNALLNPNIKLVALQGVAGTGKNIVGTCSSLGTETPFTIKLYWLDQSFP